MRNCIHQFKKRFDVLEIGQICLLNINGTVQLTDLISGLVGGLRVCMKVEQDGISLPSQIEGKGFSEAVRRAGHKRKWIFRHASVLPQKRTLSV